AHIEHEATTVALGATPRGCKRGGHGFLHQFDLLEADLPGRTRGGLALGEFEERGDRDDGCAGARAELPFDVRDEASKHHRGELFGAHGRGTTFELERTAAAHQPLM